MNIKNKGNDLIISGLADFNLRHIFDCGQCFRWNAVDEDTYFGLACGKALKIAQNGDTVTMYETSEADFHNIWFNYFDLGTDYGKIKEALAKDETMREAVKYGGGIRILRQDLWESVISFIISSSNNIPRIKGIIERLCTLYGKEITYMEGIYYAFPDIDTLAALSRDELAPIRVGYRDKYILDAAQKFKNGILSEKYIRSLDAEGAKDALMSINGVGNKVANCIMLFALSHRESFPVDVWIKRIVEYCYFDGEQSVNTISDFAKRQFGTLGGYAQQYLFYYARENKIGIV